MKIQPKLPRAKVLIINVYDLSVPGAETQTFYAMGFPCTYL